MASQQKRCQQQPELGAGTECHTLIAVTAARPAESSRHALYAIAGESSAVPELSRMQTASVTTAVPIMTASPSLSAELP